MSRNLVALHIDKSTGDIVASNDIQTNPGSGSGNSGFEFKQLTPLLSWNIFHNVNTKRLICQIYNNTDEMIFPDSIKILSNNNILVTFNTVQAGSAKIIFF